MRKTIYHCLLFFCLSVFIFPIKSQSQTLSACGVPFIPQVLSYSSKDYVAGNQNWSVCQDADGVIYFGNNQGLLRYDGVHWSLYRLPNNSVVRSVFVDDEKRIFVGGYEEFGYFQADARNQLQYTSLSHTVKPEMTLNDEFWTIQSFKGKVFFQSFSSFYIYDGQEVSKGMNSDIPLYLFKASQQLYMQYINGDFARYNGVVFQEMISRKQLDNSSVVASLAFRKGLILVTDQGGIFYSDPSGVSPWANEINTSLKSAVCNRAILTPDSTLIIGTISDGVYALSKQGKLLWHLNRENALKNNTVLALYCDRDQNVWIGLDNGIAYVRKNSPISTYEPTDVDLGMVYDMLVDHQNFFWATNQGVFRYSREQNRAVQASIPKDQSWHLTRIDQQVFLGHNKGVYSLNDKRDFSLIEGPYPGGIMMRKCALNGRDVLLQLSYASFSVFEKDESGRWRFSHVIEGFNNRVASFEVDHLGNIWVSHLYKGVYRLTLDKSFCKVTEVVYYKTLNASQEERKIDVMKLRGRIIFTDGQQFYTYEDLNQRIIPYDLLNQSFSDLSDTYRICEVNNALSWFVRDNEYTLMGFEKGHYYVKERIPFALFQNPPIENQGMVYVPSSEVSYFSLNGGVGCFDFSHLGGKSVSHLLFVSAVITHKNDSIVYQSLRHEKKEFLPFIQRDLDVQLSYPDFSGEEVVLQGRLKDLNQDWFVIGNSRVAYLRNLPYGKHQFESVVKDPKGKVLARCLFSFEVERPFYESYLAYFIYFLALLGCLYWILRRYTYYVRCKQETQIQKMRQEQAEQLKQQEQLIMKLEKDNLANQVVYKSKELAGAAMTLIQYDDFLKALKADLQQQMIKGNATRKFYEGLIHRIDDKLIEDDEWGVFQANFDRIHENFFRNLKDRYPELTAGDLRLCALLRLNMSTKDMARMQNLSIRGVEAARYRLRKKLNLNEGCNLVDFMIQFR